MSIPPDDDGDLTDAYGTFFEESGSMSPRHYSPDPPVRPHPGPRRNNKKAAIDPDGQPVCVLCRLKDANIASDGSIVGNNECLNRAMAEECANYGRIPDDILFKRMVDMFNTTVADVMVKKGGQCERWTVDMVRRHFTVCVDFLPRRMLRESLDGVCALERVYMSSMFPEREPGEPPPASGTEKPPKDDVATYLNVLKMKETLVKQIEAYHAADRKWSGSTATVSAPVMTDDEALRQSYKQTAAIKGSGIGFGDRLVGELLFKD